jgi:hypothetical protein
MERFVGGVGLNSPADSWQFARHPRMFVSGIQNFGLLKAGFPIRTVSGMTTSANEELLEASA